MYKLIKFSWSTTLITIVLFLFFLFCVMTTLLKTDYDNVSNAVNKKSKIIIDNDAGGDDAMAIFLALLYEKYFDGPQVIGLTTANGNTIEDNVCINDQKILKKAQRQDVPIYRGSRTSLVTTPPTTAYYGHDGLGDNGESTTGLVPAQSRNAVSALIELSKAHEGELTVVTIGTLTNIALAIRLDPGFLGRLAQLYIAAGHIHDEANPSPEFNAKMDVEAYHIVVQNATPDKVTIFPFSQTMSSLNLTKAWREKVLGAIDTDIIKAQNVYERVALNRSDMWHALDPAALAVVLKPELVQEYRYSKNDIIVCGDERGLNTNTFVEKAEANVRVIYYVNVEEYKQFLLNVFSAELSHNNYSKALN